MKHRQWVIATGVLACCVAVADAQIDSRAVLVRYKGSTFSVLSISGHYFGTRDPQSFVTVTFANGTTQTLMSATARLWLDDHITIDLPANAALKAATVTTAASIAASAAIVGQYQLDFFDTTTVLQGAPLVLTADNHGRIWVNSEFHSGYAYWDPADHALHALAGYSQPVNPIFLYGSTPTKYGIFGEAALYDGHGRVWLTEGGWEPSLADASLPNHSRLIAVDTASLQTRILAVPGNRNGVIGVACDELRGRIWFTQSARKNLRTNEIIEPAKLISFDPNTLPFEDSAFDWVPRATCTITTGQTIGTCSNAAAHHCQADRDCILVDRLCSSDVPGCYHEYALPAAAIYQPAEVAVDAQGRVWFTNFFAGGDIMRLDPDTGALTVVPLSPPPNGIGVTWPWDIRIAHNGDVLSYEYNSARIARLSAANFDRDCSQLVHPDGVTSCEYAPGDNPAFGYRDPQCYNPCIEETPVEPTLFVASTAADDVVIDEGYLRNNGEFIHYPRVMTIFPNGLTPPGDYPEALGAVSYVSPTGVVWGADYYSRRLSRLTPAPCGAGGEQVETGCWYLGAPGANCTTTCADHGGYNYTEALTTTKTAGIGKCLNVLQTLGANYLSWKGTSGGNTGCQYKPGNGSASTRSDSLADTWASSIQRACACNR